MFYDENKEIIEMKALLENDLNIRFDMDQNKIFTWATLLDPRYKQQFFEVDDLISIQYQFLLKLFQDDRSSAANELQSYCALPVIKRNDDPFQWWSRNSSRYPEMSRMAKVYLCFPASSVYSERLFSEAGSIYETKRNRLLPERAEALVFLHHNLPLIKKYK